jgi:RNA polymerase sigma-70 factor (ECF subfamily)
MENDNEITFKAIRKGDVRAFETFYRKYQPRLFAYGMGILNDEETTKDVVQEAFLAFWEHRANIVTDFSVTAYLFKIFHGICLKRLRMQAIQSNFSELSDLKMKEIEIAYYNPDRNILGSVFMHEVEEIYEKAVRKLPEQCREIFLLSKQNDLKSSEIAAQLGLSVRTVENQIYRAIHFLRQEMKDYALPAVAAIFTIVFFI